MTDRIAVAALVLVSLTGCASFDGRSRTFDAARLTADQGWVAAAPTPMVRQAGAVDCGAAALAMIAGRWQVPLSLEEAAAALPVRAPERARLGDLRDLARARGLQAFAIVGDRDTLVHELRAGRPVILGLHILTGLRTALSHYEVIVAMHPVDDQFVTLDPGSGWRTRTWADLDAEWLPAGRPALVVTGVKSGPSTPGPERPPAAEAGPSRSTPEGGAGGRLAFHEGWTQATGVGAIPREVRSLAAYTIRHN